MHDTYDDDALDLSDRRRLKVLRLLSSSCPTGCIVEVGVQNGTSAIALYETAIKQDRKLFLYDTFSGHPYYREDLDIDQLGDRVGDEALVRRRFPHAKVIKGIFPESLIKMPPIAFAHIDVDQYDSYRLSIAALRDLMVDGGMMVFDDWNKHEGCKQAVREAFGKQNIGIFKQMKKAFYVFGEASDELKPAIDTIHELPCHIFGPRLNNSL